jgi:hypothetical protein
MDKYEKLGFSKRTYSPYAPWEWDTVTVYEKQVSGKKLMHSFCLAFNLFQYDGEIIPEEEFWQKAKDN